MVSEKLAIEFGEALDADDFPRAKELLSNGCEYLIGDQHLVGPDQIIQSYENNMLEGRRKLDDLVWGPSRIERIDDDSFFVHFTDYLTHRGQSHTHRCKQKITFDRSGQISRIDHIDDAEERSRLNSFYASVGLKP